MIECANDEFQCYDGVKCLQWSYRCDRIAHCHDNSDEADCAGTVHVLFNTSISPIQH